MIFVGLGKGKAKHSNAPTDSKLFHSVDDTAIAKRTDPGDTLSQTTICTNGHNGKAYEIEVVSRQISSAKVFRRAELNLESTMFKIVDRWKQNSNQAAIEWKQTLEEWKLQKQAFEM